MRSLSSLIFDPVKRFNRCQALMLVHGDAALGHELAQSWDFSGAVGEPAMIRSLLLVLPAISAGKLCDGNSSIPCVQLHHGVQMPMVALGSWRGSYKDCANNNYSCAQDHARHAVQSWLQSVGGTHVDSVCWQGAAVWKSIPGKTI